jgi:hypothetical protein
MPTSSSGDVIGPAAEGQPFYNPVVYGEILDGTNAGGELFNSWLLIVGEALL